MDTLDMIMISSKANETMSSAALYTRLILLRLTIRELLFTAAKIYGDITLLLVSKFLTN